VRRAGRRGRRIVVRAALSAVLLLLAHAIYWRIAAGRLQAGFQTWIENAQRQGWSVRTGGVTVGGWPIAAQLTVADPIVSGGEPLVPGGMTWDAGQVALRVELLQPWQLVVAPVGMQHLRFRDGTEVKFVADRMDAVTPLQPEPSRAVDVQASRLRVLLPDLGGAESSVTVGVAGCALRFAASAEAGEESLGFAVSAEAIELPDSIHWPLGRSVKSFSADGALEGPLPSAASPAGFAKAWRDSGGSLKVQKANLVWGPLTLELAATLALDEQLQPMGAGNSRIIGYDATLDALAGNGVLTRSAVTAAKAVLSLLANAPAEGEAAEVEVPLTLQYRTLSMRQVPLIRFPELDWPSP
jgi:hypothetical protein